MAEFASKGVAGTALGLGIAGTALGLGMFGNKNCGEGGLGGLFGNNGNNGNCHVTQTEMAYINQLNAERALNAQITAERYADMVGINTYKEAVAISNRQDDKFSLLLKDVTTEVVRQGQETAVLKANITCLNSKVDYENAALLTEIKNTAANANTNLAFATSNLTKEIALEAERRSCADQNIMTYIQGNYIMADKYLSGSKVFCPDSSICDGKTVTPK